MENMTAFFGTTLSQVASFLAAEPIIYFVGILLLCFTIKSIKMIIDH